MTGVNTARPIAALFGERVGRVLVGVPTERTAVLGRMLDDHAVPGRRIGQIGGDRLILRVGDAVVEFHLAELEMAWRRPF